MLLTKAGSNPWISACAEMTSTDDFQKSIKRGRWTMTAKSESRIKNRPEFQRFRLNLPKTMD